MVAGAIVGGLALGFAGGAQSRLLLGILWVLVQLGLHGLEVPMDAYLVDAFPPSRRGLAAGVVGLALASGTSAGALLAGFLAERPPIATWILAAGVAFAVAIFAVVVRDATASARPCPLAAAAGSLAHARCLPRRASGFPLFCSGASATRSPTTRSSPSCSTSSPDLIGATTLEERRWSGRRRCVAGAASATTVLGGGWLRDRLGRRRLFLLIGSGALICGDLLLPSGRRC